MSDDSRDKGEGDDFGRRPGRNTTFESPAYEEELDPIRGEDLMDPDGTGAELDAEPEAGYYQATAMFDKGQFLGELAELEEGAPETRAAVEVEPEPPRGCKLIVVAGQDIGLEWAFKDPEVVIGRDEVCQLVMSDIAVSRQHAKIALEDGRFTIADLGSNNGTFLNGVRLEAREDLSSGDEIIIGERTVRFVELNESPPTAAAYPVGADIVQEPSIGDAPVIDDPAEDPELGKQSQVDVDVIPEEDGPAGDVSLPKAEAADGRPQQGRALRIVSTIAGALALLVALTIAFIVYIKGEDEELIRAQALVKANHLFLQGIELAKGKRCGDANILFSGVLSALAEYDTEGTHAYLKTRAVEYQTFCQGEVKIWKGLEGAKKLAAGRRYNEAIERIKTLKIEAGEPPKSRYEKEAMRQRRRYARIIAKELYDEALRARQQDELDRAMRLIERALGWSPDLLDAKLLRGEIEELLASQKPTGKKKPSYRVPPELQRAVALYKNDMIGAAIDAARAAGGSNASTYVARMKRVKTLLAEATTAHRKKAAAELLRIAPAALELDKQISGSDGKVRDRLNRYYANGLYLKGIEAFQESNYVRAYQLLNEALKAQPGHKLASSRVAELDRMARDMYYEGYVLKDSNKAKARKIFRRITQMTRSSNQYHRLAAKWLRNNGG